MRIIAGHKRGAHLYTPTDDSIRPTLDRHRQALFNMLQHHFPTQLRDTQVLDLFAGTGALGLEALSRGARHAIFVDNNPQSVNLVQRNIVKLGYQDQTSVQQQDALVFLQQRNTPADLIFLDPPYHKKPEIADIGLQTLNALTSAHCVHSATLVILESALPLRQESLLHWRLPLQKIYKQTCFNFLLRN